jgi:hypothetical protein
MSCLENADVAEAMAQASMALAEHQRITGARSTLVLVSSDTPDAFILLDGICAPVSEFPDVISVLSKACALVNAPVEHTT